MVKYGLVHFIWAFLFSLRWSGTFDLSFCLLMMLWDEFYYCDCNFNCGGVEMMGGECDGVALIISPRVDLRCSGICYAVVVSQRCL
jgi:hypothetical protein